MLKTRGDLVKKKISFLVILTIVLLATQVSADTISQIGKKVSGESSVYLNGNKLENAIIVDGTSYAPLRSVSEAYGNEISFEKTKEGNVIKMDTPELTKEEIEQVKELNWAKAKLEAAIQGAKNTIEWANQNIDASKKMLEIEKNENRIKFYEEEISKAQQEIIQAQEDIITYTNELLELESSK